MITKYPFTDILNRNLPSELSISGIYCIYNKSRRVYVGSSVDILNRIKCHLSQLKNNKHGNKHFQRAYIKYSIESFYFTVLEYVPLIEDLFTREAYWIDYIKPSYNMQLVPEKRPDGSQYWILCDSNDKWYFIKNLTQFCRDHNLNKQSLYRIARGVQKDHEGWFCRRATDYESQRRLIDRITKTITNKSKYNRSGVYGIRYQDKRWMVKSPYHPRIYIGTSKSLEKAKQMLSDWLNERGRNILDYLFLN